MPSMHQNIWKSDEDSPGFLFFAGACLFTEPAGCCVGDVSGNVHPATPVLLLRAVPNPVRHGHAGGKAHGDVCVAAVWALRLAGC